MDTSIDTLDRTWYITDVKKQQKMENQATWFIDTNGGIFQTPVFQNRHSMRMRTSERLVR